LIPVLYKIGDQWENGEIDVATEHVCSNAVNNLIDLINQQNTKKNFKNYRDTRSIVLSTPEGEIHSIGCKIIESLLLEKGYEVYNITSPLPTNSIESCLNKVRSTRCQERKHKFHVLYLEYMNIYPPVEQRFSPFEFYSLMRKNNPIAFDEGNKQWGLYRYSDIEKILRDPIKFSSKFGPFQVPQEYQENLNRPSLLNSDPPYHRKLRSIVDTLFVPIEISKLAPRIENIVNELIDTIIEKNNNTTTSTMD
jgi:hypothetical protein